MTATSEAAVAMYGPEHTPEERRRAFIDGRVPVAVYGLGKMGLPLAAVYAGVTGNVRGVDIDPSVVERVNRGECPVTGEPGLPELVASLRETGALAATDASERAAREARIHVVIVPTVVREDRTPDLSALDAAVDAIGIGLDAGDVVIVESTVPPGTTTERVGPRLEAASGLAVGEFGLAFCPERTSSGRALADIRGSYPKVVGGVDAESTRAVATIYGEVTDNRVIPVADATTAECVKVFEGVYRDVNIALANELGTFVDDLGIDVREAIAAANSQPYCDIHDPGPGVGGHCIPYYPWFVVDRVERDAPLIRAARSVNESMPAFVADRLLASLDRRGVPPGDARVLLLGVTYRPGVEETRESPTYPIAARLTAAGATVYAVDPMLADFGSLDAARVDLEDAYDLGLNAVAVITPHEAFDDVDWSAFEDLLVFDGRDALDLADTPHEVYTIGRGVT